MEGIWASRWNANFKDNQSITNWKDAWAEALDEERITLNEIKTGLATLRRESAWPPTLPEFLAACRPIPDACSAYHEAVKGKAARDNGKEFTYSHPAVFWAGAEFGSRDLAASSWRECSERWGALFRAVLQRGSWPAIPPVVPIDHYLPSKTDGLAARPEEVEKQLAGLREKMRMPSRPAQKKAAESTVSKQERAQAEAELRSRKPIPMPRVLK